MSLYEYRYDVSGISCTACIGGINLQFSKAQSESVHEPASWQSARPVSYRITAFAVDALTKIVTIHVSEDEHSPEELIRDFTELFDEIGLENTFLTRQEIRGESFVPVPDDEEDDDDVSRFSIDEIPDTENQLLPEPQSVGSRLWHALTSRWFQGGVGIALGLTFMILGMVFPAMPLALMIAMGVVSAVLTLILGARSYYDAAYKLFKSRTLTMDFLFSLSTLTIIAVSIAAFFVPWMPMMMDAGLLIFGCRHIGRAIEDSLIHRMMHRINFRDALPRTVRIRLRNGEQRYCLLRDVREGDVLIMEAGESLPVDGISQNAGGLLNLNNLWGRPMERVADKGDALVAGISLQDGSPPLLLKATSTADNSYLAGLDRSIALANDEKAEKAPIQEMAERILQYFIPAVLALAILSAAIIAVFCPLALAIQCAVVILVSACPCTLGLVVPLSVKFGMQKAAKLSVRFRNTHALQAADNIDVVVLDLNGTLTLGTPVVEQFYPFDSEDDPRALLAFAASMEQGSRRPMAQAICSYAADKGVACLPGHEDWVMDESCHSGLRVEQNGDTWVIGNTDMLKTAGIEMDQYPEPPNLQAGDSVVYLARNKRILGCFRLHDPLRHDVHHTIRALTNLGKHVRLCTGADKATAQRYARLLGIPDDDEHIVSDCVGRAMYEGQYDKRSHIAALKASGLRVCMVGDAGNDALALAESDFGIAIKSGCSSSVTEQQAGAVVHDQCGSLMPVANAFAVAKQTVFNIKQNMLFSLGYNVFFIALTIALLVAVNVVLPPGVGVALMFLQAFVLIGLAWHLTRQPIAHLESLDGNDEGVGSSYAHVLENTLGSDDQPSHDFGHEAAQEPAYSRLPSSVAASSVTEPDELRLSARFSPV